MFLGGVFMDDYIKEIWKDIEGYEGLYQVSNLGRIKSLSRKIKRNDMNAITKEKIMKQAKDDRGYLMANLYKNGRNHSIKVHRLVAKLFIPNPLNLPQVNHIDEVKTNNSVSNLEWCTNKYNINYGKHNLNIAKSLSKRVYQYTKNNVLVKAWNSTIQCSRENSEFNHRHISECCLGKRKTHKKYKWSYVPL